MEIREGYIKFKNYQTYYRIVNPSGRKLLFYFVTVAQGLHTMLLKP